VDNPTAGCPSETLKRVEIAGNNLGVICIANVSLHYQRLVLNVNIKLSTNSLLTFMVRYTCPVACHAHYNMPLLRSCFLFIFMLLSPICQAAWVRKFRCGSSHPSAPSDSPFWIDSLHGTFDTFDASIVLSLSLLGVHNQSRFSCNDLNLTGFETDLRFHVLGLPVGQVEAFRSQCPLPITETLTP
jgi:hypothetical protein